MYFSNNLKFIFSNELEFSKDFEFLFIFFIYIIVFSLISRM